MNWGKSIVLAFVGFAAFIISLVYVCVRQEINLVSADYYQQELRYQEQIDRINNTAMLTNVPSLQIVNDTLVLRYSELPNTADASLKLVRPSSSKYDVEFTIPATGSTTAAYSLKNLPNGRYKGSFQWTIEGKEYYVEKLLDL